MDTDTLAADEDEQLTALLRQFREHGASGSALVRSVRPLSTRCWANPRPVRRDAVGGVAQPRPDLVVPRAEGGLLIEVVDPRTLVASGSPELVAALAEVAGTADAYDETRADAYGELHAAFVQVLTRTLVAQPFVSAQASMMAQAQVDLAERFGLYRAGRDRRTGRLEGREQVGVGQPVGGRGPDLLGQLAGGSSVPRLPVQRGGWSPSSGDRAGAPVAPRPWVLRVEHRALVQWAHRPVG